MIKQIKGKDHNIIKRDGRSEKYSQKKLKKAIDWCTNGNEVLTEHLFKALNIKIYNKIKIEKLWDEVIETSANMISEMFPIWDDVAKRAFILKIYKETYNLKSDTYYPNYSDVVKKGIQSGIYDREIISSFSDEELKKLGDAIKPERDLNFTFIGLIFMYDKYCLNYSLTKKLELPQHAYIRISMYPFYKVTDSEEKLRLIIQRYEDISLHRFTEATPKVVNSMTPNSQMSSCVLNTVSDDIESINTTGSNIGIFSKYGGGTAVDVSAIRGKGSQIGKLGGKSSGAINFIKLYESYIVAYNQNGKRAGACVVSYPFWHLDVFDLLMLKDSGGSDDNRARKLQYALKWYKILSKRIQADGEITLFDPKETPELNRTWGDEFEKWYLHYENKTGIRKKRVQARELAFLIVKVRSETGNLYITFVDNINNQRVGEEPVFSSNLCVTGDTKILTKDYGYIEIKKVSGTNIDCWNGQSWSKNVPIFKTSENQKVIKVSLSNYTTIKATPYHRWIIVKQDKWGADIGETIKQTTELQIDDKLIKFNLEPIPHGSIELDLAYENGFFTGDGTSDKSAKYIDLYKDKKNLLNEFSTYISISESVETERLRLRYRKDSLKGKFFLPNKEYSINSRLKWLAGLFDSNATLTDNQGIESIELVSVNLEFLQSLLLLLQELGIDSKIVHHSGGGYKKLPKNNSSDELKEYFCETAKKVIIVGSELNNLLSLGYKAHRVMPTKKDYQQEAKQYVKVVSIEDNNEISPTYCGTNPDNERLMFNGNLTLNCQEVLIPSKPETPLKTELAQDIDDKNTVTIKMSNTGEIGLCNLSSINLVEWMKLDLKEKESLIDNLLLASDNMIDLAFYPVKDGEFSNKSRRPIGIGVNNYANYLASQKILFTDEVAKQITHELMEDITYFVLKGSVKLAKKRGAYKYFKDSNWAKGILPMDLYLMKENEKYNFPLKYDWDSLRQDIINFGVRFSYHFAIAPTASSGLVINSTEGVEPVRTLFSIREGTYTQPHIVPDLQKNRFYYQNAFDIPNGVIYDLASIRQKFLDQSQSVSSYYKTTDSAFVMIKDIIKAENVGMKTLYYLTPMKAGESSEACESCSS